MALGTGIQTILVAGDHVSADDVKRIAALGHGKLGGMRGAPLLKGSFDGVAIEFHPGTKACIAEAEASSNTASPARSPESPE